MVVAKAKRAKGDPRYDPTPFKVVAKHCGDLGLVAEYGYSPKRNITLVKKLREKPQTESQNKAGGGSERKEAEAAVGNEAQSETDLQPPQQVS